MSERVKKEMGFLAILILIGVLLAGCGVQVSSGTEDDKEPPGQAKQTEVEEVENTSGEPGEEEIALPTDLPPTEEPTPTFTPQAEEKTDPVDPTPAVIIGGEKEDMIAKCKADLASRLGISQDQISVVSAVAVTWNNSSLGCPEKGMMYTQVLTPGYRIILEADGTQYDYRTGNSGNILLCEK